MKRGLLAVGLALAAAIAVLVMMLVNKERRAQVERDRLALEDQARAEEDDARREHEAQAKASADAIGSAEAKRKADKASAAKSQAELDALTAQMHEIGPAGRRALVEKICNPNGEGPCNVEQMNVLITFAESPAEREALKSAGEKAIASYNDVMHAATRKAFAKAYDEALLEKHMNPQAVFAERETLVVQGWFCSRQFVYDFLHDEKLPALALASGITAIKCVDLFGRATDGTIVTP